MPTLVEKRRESWDHFISDEIVYGTERCDPSFKNTVASRDWLSDYKLKRGWLEVNFVPMRKSESKLNAVIQMSPRVVRKWTDVSMHDLAAQFGGSDREHPMLIDGREAIQYPKRVRLESVPSVIRLKRFDNRNGIGQNVLDGITESSGGNIANREGRGTLRTSGMKTGQAPSKLIQAGSKRIDKLSDQKWDFDRDSLALYAHNMAKVFVIVLARDGVRFWVKDLRKYGIDFIEVMFRPHGFELQLG
jgi:hypothetical protein